GLGVVGAVIGARAAELAGGGARADQRALQLQHAARAGGCLDGDASGIAGIAGVALFWFGLRPHQALRGPVAKSALQRQHGLGRVLRLAQVVARRRGGHADRTCLARLAGGGFSLWRLGWGRAARCHTAKSIAETGRRVWHGDQRKLTENTLS